MFDRKDTIMTLEAEGDSQLGYVDSFITELEESKDAAIALIEHTKTNIKRLQDVQRKAERVKKFSEKILKESK